MSDHHRAGVGIDPDMHAQASSAFCSSSATISLVETPRATAMARDLVGMGLGQLEREGHQAGGLIQLALFAPVGQLGGRAETVRRAGLLSWPASFRPGSLQIEFVHRDFPVRERHHIRRPPRPRWRFGVFQGAEAFFRARAARSGRAGRSPRRPARPGERRQQVLAGLVHGAHDAQRLVAGRSDVVSRRPCRLSPPRRVGPDRCRRRCRSASARRLAGAQRLDGGGIER